MRARASCTVRSCATDHGDSMTPQGVLVLCPKMCNSSSSHLQALSLALFLATPFISGWGQGECEDQSEGSGRGVVDPCPSSLLAPGWVRPSVWQQKLRMPWPDFFSELKSPSQQLGWVDVYTEFGTATIARFLGWRCLMSEQSCVTLLDPASTGGQNDGYNHCPKPLLLSTTESHLNCISVAAVSVTTMGSCHTPYPQ